MAPQVVERGGEALQPALHVQILQKGLPRVEAIRSQSRPGSVSASRVACSSTPERPTVARIWAARLLTRLASAATAGASTPVSSSGVAATMR